MEKQIKAIIEALDERINLLNPSVNELNELEPRIGVLVEGHRNDLQDIRMLLYCLIIGK